MTTSCSSRSCPPAGALSVPGADHPTGCTGKPSLDDRFVSGTIIEGTATGKSRFIEGRRLDLDDLHDPALVDEIGRCLLAVAQHETTACLLHGDPNFKNFLLRRSDHRLFLVDFDSTFDGPFLFDVLYFMVRVLNYASGFEVDASNSSRFTAIFRGLVRPFRSSMRFGSRVSAEELVIQWRYVSHHFSRKWGESQTNERIQTIITAWSEILSASLFDNACA